MLTSRRKVKEIEFKKRCLFLGATGAGIGVFLTFSPWLGLPLAALGGFWGLDWFRFRARNGMRF